MRVFVTGAASGFGAAVTRALLARGDAVVGVDLHAEAVTEAVGAHPALLALRLDLREPGSIEAAAREALAQGPVHALVNNAGYAVFGAQDEADLDAVSAMLDANVIGQVRVTRALLPALRAARGTVVQLSSIAGRMVFPESGFYAASKHALEALSEALYVENAPEGLRVAVIQPGAFATGFGARATRASRPRDPVGAHQHHHGAWDAEKHARLAPPQPAQLVATAILAALDGGPAFQRVPVGIDAEAILADRSAQGDDAWVRAYAEAVRVRIGEARIAG